MLLVARHLHGASVVASDGVAGKVYELLFDDQSWEVRNLVVETGGWWQSRDVLLSPAMIDHHDATQRRLVIRATRRELRELPLASTFLPVARRRLLEASQIIAWEAYWTKAVDLSAQTPGHPHLRSTRILPGLRVVASDGKIGHLADFLVDDQTWSIRYVGIDTRNWWPGRHVLIEPMWIESIDWDSHRVQVSMPRERIEHSPSYDPSATVEADQELAASGRGGGQ